MLKKIIFSLILASAALSFLGGQMSASENEQIARLNWNINIGFYPYCGPYYPAYYSPYYYPYAPPCAYPYPAPYWAW